MRRRLMIGLVAVGSLMSLLTGLALAQAKKPDATMSLTEGTVGVGIGCPGAKGRSATRERPIPSRLKGSRSAMSAMQKATATGNVYDLKKIEDFDGNYTAGGRRGDHRRGRGYGVMKNQNGVVIEMKSTTQGANLKLAAEGLKLSVQK